MIDLLPTASNKFASNCLFYSLFRFDEMVVLRSVPDWCGPFLFKQKLVSQKGIQLIDYTNSAVQKHIDIQQSIIERMASNCSSCKNWAITIISAVLVIAYQDKSGTLGLVSLIPLVLFFLLDGFYLSLERDVRDSMAKFVSNLHAGTLQEDEIFGFQLKVGFIQRTKKTIKAAFSSPSILPFYSLFLFLLIISKFIF